MQRICAEFGISSSTGFKGGDNHGLGPIFIYVPYVGPEADHSLSYPRRKTFSDEGGKSTKGNLIYFIRNDNAKIERQFDFFMEEKSGLTQAGMARLNHWIEAFVYRILGTQVSVRSSILGSSGSAKEAQREFLILVDDAIRMPDISKNVQRFQFAIDKAKVRLDLAVSPSTWLMPSNLLVNTQSMVGYNKSRKKASSDMKLGVKNH